MLLFWRCTGLLDQLKVRPGHIIVDGNRFKNTEIFLTFVLLKVTVKYMSIAAASVLAKLTGTNIWKTFMLLFPFTIENKGYPTQEHRKGIEQAGVTEFHQLSVLPLFGPHS